MKRMRLDLDFFFFFFQALHFLIFFLIFFFLSYLQQRPEVVALTRNIPHSLVFTNGNDEVFEKNLKLKKKFKNFKLKN